MKHNAAAIGLDIAKNVFYAVGKDERGNEVLKRKMSRDQVLELFANLPAANVGIEACATAHYWARELNKLGHDVKLIAGQRVSRRVLGNKNDYRDAKAICDLRSEPETLYVPINSEAQQESLPRVALWACADAAPSAAACGGEPHGADVADTQSAGRIWFELPMQRYGVAQRIERGVGRRTPRSLLRCIGAICRDAGAAHPAE